MYILNTGERNRSVFPSNYDNNCKNIVVVDNILFNIIFQDVRDIFNNSTCFSDYINLVYGIQWWVMTS